MNLGHLEADRVMVGVVVVVVVGRLRELVRNGPNARQRTGSRYRSRYRWFGGNKASLSIHAGILFLALIDGGDDLSLALRRVPGRQFSESIPMFLLPAPILSEEV
ncbi:hypothetical protein B0H67DRAFT_158988 [Lasiosphaeris hirsuta]|uniref:Uncharacterized protein n=1 Tax=Lasiosphaeris hirsuta TaxID=260670 RepID=A0AA40E1X6_9PEZI|nr:hypothetical protein B0H67DRAFT_158988 [Lasiosphaeris hirsuta]